MRRDFLFVGTGHRLFNDPTGDHLTGHELRTYLIGSDALREEARVLGETEEACLERLVEIAGRANAAVSHS